MAGVDAGRAVPSSRSALLLLVASAPRPPAHWRPSTAGSSSTASTRCRCGVSTATSPKSSISPSGTTSSTSSSSSTSCPTAGAPSTCSRPTSGLEGRYDCIYTSGCGMFPSVNTYGNDSQDLPLRLRDAVDDSWAGTIPVNDKEVPPGKVPLVPTSGPRPARDPVPWGILVLTATPLGDKGVDYDPPFGLERPIGLGIKTRASRKTYGKRRTCTRFAGHPACPTAL